MEGYTVGKHYASHYTDRKFILFSQEGNTNTEKRIEGFTAAVEEKFSGLMNDALRIKLDNKIFKDYKLLPSKLAPLLT